MNRELKLQAWLDGELPQQEANLFHEQLSAEEQNLVSELKSVKSVLVPVNEVDVKVPDTRDFYWRQIQRRIESQEAKAPVREESFISQWRRFLVPMAGVAGAAALLLVTLNHSVVPSQGFYEAAVDAKTEMESVTFQDFSAGMTVVWLQDKNQAPPQTDESQSHD